MNKKEEKAIFDGLYALTKSITTVNNTLSCLRSDIQLLTESVIFSESKSFESYVMDRLSVLSPGKPETFYTREQILKKLFPYLFSAELIKYDKEHPITAV